MYFVFDFFSFSEHFSAIKLVFVSQGENQNYVGCLHVDTFNNLLHEAASSSLIRTSLCFLRPQSPSTCPS